MNKDVIISVKGVQFDIENDRNDMELVTEGKYYKKGTNYYITYSESEVTGLEGTTTTLKVGDGRVTLLRFGAINSQMVFEQGQKHVSHYDTNYGAFTVGVTANEVNVNVNENGGEINVNYQVELNNSQTGKNVFSISVREAGGKALRLKN